MTSSPHQDVALIIFVKDPVPGKVKTRLAASIGDEAACAIYRRLLHHTESISRDIGLVRYVYYDERITETDLWSHPGTLKERQSRGNLGERMQAAFSQVLQRHDRALIIGSDCGELSEEHLRAAVDGLRFSDLVLGPTYDGGYYLLGMKHVIPDLFNDIPWSSDHVFGLTLSRIIERALNFKLLERLSDVDTEADWQQLGWPSE